jgi:hypothetical protein
MGNYIFLRVHNQAGATYEDDDVNLLLEGNFYMLSVLDWKFVSLPSLLFRPLIFST